MCRPTCARRGSFARPVRRPRSSCGGPCATSRDRWLSSGALCTAWVERQLLDAPVEQLGDVELVLGRAGDLVDPSELLDFLSRLAEYAEGFALERELVDPPRHRVGAVKDLIRRRRDADRPWRARCREGIRPR